LGIIFLLLSFFTYSKNITLDLTNTTFPEILQILSRKYNINFVLDNNILKNKRYFLKVKNIPLKNLLNILLYDTPYTYTYQGNVVYFFKKENKKSICNLVYEFKHTSPNSINFPKDLNITKIDGKRVYLKIPCSNIKKILSFLEFLDKKKKQFQVSLIFFSIDNLNALEKAFNITLNKNKLSLSLSSGISFSFSTDMSLDNILAKLSYLQKIGISKIYSQQSFILSEDEEGIFSQDYTLDYFYKDSDGDIKIRTYKLPLKLSLKISSFKNQDKINLKFKKGILNTLSDSYISYHVDNLESNFFIYPNQVLIIGGFEIKEEKNTEYKNAFSKIPLLGDLFKNKKNSLSKKKMYILLKIEEL